MTLGKIVDSLHLKVHTGASLLGREVTGGYAGDLLSDVLAHAAEGAVWVTLHTHANVVAVASTKQLAGVIIVNGRVPDEGTTRAAAENGVPLLIAGASSFRTVSELSRLGVS